jgi:pilus assembly protein Flp/PilA
MLLSIGANKKGGIKMNQLSKLYVMLTIFMGSLKSRKGQTMVEYALLLALIAIVVMVAVAFLGGNIGNKFNTVGNALT